MIPNRTLVPLLALLCVAAPGKAQEPSDTTSPVPLPGLTVTVLRTPIELRRVPYSVSINTQEEIQRARPGLGLDEALRGIPGVQVDNRFNYALGERLSIRGFGARAQFGVRGVKVLVDGIPATFPDGQTSLSHLDLGFVRRAEVVRGPASALYGSSAGGVVQFETEAFPERPLAQEVGVTAGSHGLLRVHSTTGGQSGRAGYLLNLSRVGYEGHREFNSAENLRLNARLGYTGERSRLRVAMSAVDYDARNPGSLSETLLQEDRSQAFANNVRQRTGEEGRQGQVGATWTRSAGAGEWEVAGYAIGRSVDNPIPNAIVVLDRTASGARAIFRSGTPRLNWAVGLQGDLQRDDRQNFANAQGERGALSLDQRERVTNLAAFAQAGAQLAARLTLLGGLRYDWYRFAADDALITDSNPDDSGRITMAQPSPSVGVTYEVADALNLYANVATSFETPTTTELANRPSGAGGFNPELEPQEAISYEVGSRGWWGAWLQYQLAAYHADVTNALIPFEVPQAPGRQFFRNAGSANHRGVEAALTVAPLAGARLRAAYTYTDARFESFTSGDDVLDGNRIPGVAPHRAELLLSYQAPGGWFASAESRYSSRLAVDDRNTTFSPDYVVTDVRAGMERLRVGGVEVEPFVGITNLLDAEYNTSVVVNAFGGRYFEPGPGRSLYAGVQVRL